MLKEDRALIAITASEDITAMFNEYEVAILTLS